PRKAEGIVEDGVHQLRHRWARAEIRREAEHLAEAALAGIKAPPHLLVERDVGTPKTVDALLGISHHEEGTHPGARRAPVTRGAVVRRSSGKEEEKLRLKRVRVLELVHQDVAVAGAQVLAGGGRAAEQFRGQDQEIVKGELPGAAPV